MQIKRTLPCRYCGRKMAWYKTRGCHEARCPALIRIPNNIKLYRKTLIWIKVKLETAPITKDQGKALAKIIHETLIKH